MSTNASTKVIIAALIGNAAIAITKFFAAFMTGSSAMLSEGIHSLVDTGNQILLLYGMKQAKKPADDEFPFGHGKEIYFWSFIVAILIFAVGSGVSIYEGIRHVIHPAEIKNPMVNYIVLCLALLFEGAAWFFAFKEFGKVKGKHGYIEAVQKGKDPSMFVVLFEDSAALLGLLIALLGIWLTQVTGIALFDGIASILIGLILGGTAIWLAIETKGLLIGEGANKEVINSIRKIANSFEEVEKVNELLTMHMGPEFILVNISIRFKREQLTRELEEVIQSLDAAIKAEHRMVQRIFIEAESFQE
ncbi:cation diffusion facilitator family transporter [Psychromonas ingrahamii 37]|uniref:Cation diffusion facilitator family transporter n=1 Tax=Psychromonas ingrahamii (strain DSM 17664 / CCUG 51855 / 37) TaxID=357804 RepID=A1SY78_PSYIN|nr:cation diffusion facilitator family transporter [Psychromonas ingrahamii]ABM04443.1 cation diffusion facilitator family transporter [Psychromonas ingrahamii 37]